MIAVFAFILEDSTFIRLMINKLYFVFGGLFFPLDIYPQRMQTISSYLPFKYYLYAPAKFFTTGDVSFFVHYFPIQVVRLIVL
jgi:ABC-2 type transport system permease protein